MRKTYASPAVALHRLESEETLNGVSSPGRGITYGGVDTEGAREPAARERGEAASGEWSDGLW